jgi:hypothetical protein
MSTRTVSEHALLVRINQKLEKRGQVMRRAHESVAAQARGGYHLIDVSTNFPEREHCDLEEWGRALGVLEDDEEVVAGD